MTPDQLFQRHPSLFRILRNNVSIGPGWLPLLENLAVELDRLSEKLALSQRPAFTNVRQRRGLLRVSLDAASPAMWSRIDDTEDESAWTCEECGSAAETRYVRGLVYTLCDPCCRSLRRARR